MKSKTITVRWKVKEENYKVLKKTAKAWGHETVPAYLKSIIKVMDKSRLLEPPKVRGIVEEKAAVIT